MSGTKGIEEMWREWKAESMLPHEDARSGRGPL
jgi:hypothetical protein